MSTKAPGVEATIAGELVRYDPGVVMGFEFLESVMLETERGAICVEQNAPRETLRRGKQVDSASGASSSPGSPT